MNKKETQKKVTARSSSNPLIKKYGKQARWVNYTLLNVKGRTTKVPFSPITRKNASSMKASDWGTFKQAEAVNKNNIGIVFTEEKTLLGIDIDHCLNDKGEIEHENKQQITQLVIEADTYTEISPSGTGLHIYLSLQESLDLKANRNGNFEAYTAGRYFTVTGKPYLEPKHIRSIGKQEALVLLGIIGYPWGKELHDDTESAPKSVVNEERHATNGQDGINDTYIIERMFESKGGDKIKILFNGNIDAYKADASAADMALLSHLAFWTRKDPAQMERIWQKSPLGKREKTETRKDYRDRSIASAINHCKDVYESQATKLQQEKPELDLLYTTYKGEKIFTQNTENISRILDGDQEFKGRLRYDIFRNTFEYRIKNDEWVELQDHHVIEIQTRISILFSMFGKVGKEMVYDAIVKVSREHQIDSASDWIKGLVWDKEARLDDWLSSAFNVEKSDYHTAVASNWMKGMIKRIIEPGSKFDYVLVLEGEQGIKKSTSLAILGASPTGGASWHVETAMSTDNKDFFMQFQGKAIIEFSEGETLSRTEVKRMKAIITMQSDKFRPPYGRASVDFPRRCVFAMTTNQTEYLKDETGNRRWLPVACVGIANIEWLKENRDQLFAEAYHRVITLRETVYEFPEEETRAAQASRRIHDPNEDIIAHWYFNTLSETDRDNGITIHQVYKHAINGGMNNKPLDKYTEMAIASVLRDSVRLEKERRTIDGTQAVRWFMTARSVQSAIPIPETEVEKNYKAF